MLRRHLLDTQCPAGLHEELTHEDYSISYSVSSLSEEGRRAVPQGRNEAPLHFLLHPKWVQPSILEEKDDGSVDDAHLINVYVHLLDSTRRRSALATRKRGHDDGYPRKEYYPKKYYTDRSDRERADRERIEKRPMPPPMDAEAYPDKAPGEGPKQWPSATPLPKFPNA
jgi:hypothetical protein